MQKLRGSATKNIKILTLRSNFTLYEKVLEISRLMAKLYGVKPGKKCRSTKKLQTDSQV